MKEIKSNIIKDKSNNENGSIIMQSNMTLNVNLPYNAFITTNFNSLILKNRFCFIGKSDKIFLDSDSKIKLNYFDFYINVARTGIGLICTGGFPTVVFSDKQDRITANLKEKKEEFNSFITKIHTFGCKIFYGLKSAYGRTDSENKSLGLFNYSATYNRNFNNVNWLCKKISDNMIGKIITSLSNQANFALTLGYDGILIDGDLYSLIGEFSSPELNRRKLGYFMELEDLSQNLIGKILSKNKLTKIFYTFSFKSFIEEIYSDSTKPLTTKSFKSSPEVSKVLEFMVKLVKFGVDGFIIKKGTYETEFLATSTSLQSDNDLAELIVTINEYFKSNQVKNKFGNEVFFIYQDFLYDVSDKIKDRDNILYEFTRQLLADNTCLKKIKNESTFLNCIKCGYCDSLITKESATTCILCPNSNLTKINSDSLEKKYLLSSNLTTANTPRIAVAGGGLSGINSALFLLNRGFCVDLFEKQSSLNRTSRICEIFGYNYLLKSYNDYLEQELNKFVENGKLNIFLNTTFDCSKLQDSKYLKVIVATGFYSKFSSVPGSVLKNVRNIYEILENKNTLYGKNKIVIEAKTELSLGLAQYLLLNGKKVTLLFTQLDFLFEMENSKLTYFLFALKKLNANVIILPKIKRIEMDFVELLVNSKIDSFNFQATIMNLKAKKKYKIQERAKSIDLDLFIYEPDICSNNKLYIDIVSSKYFGEVFSVGNSLMPCDFKDCIKMAYFVAKNL